MSKIDTLKKQFPELDISLLDIFQMMDPTKTNKYLQLFCKLFTKRYRDASLLNEKRDTSELSKTIEIIGIKNEELSVPQMYVIRNLLYEQYHTTTFYEIQNFIDLMERGLISENDVGKYSTFEDINKALSLSSLKQIEKEMSKQVIKGYEDENWLAVLPLTFESSSRYGAGTKWCTTYSKEKYYFAKYWNKGVLIYFINKKTGYKFAAFKEDDELSFWTAADIRTDYLELEIDDYMFPTVKKLLKTGKTNSEYLDYDGRLKVCNECSVFYDEPRRRLEPCYNLGIESMPGDHILLEEPRAEEPDYVPQPTAVPTMNA